MDEIADTACQYMKLCNQGAIARIDADASRAIARTDWEEYTRLQKVKLRVQRLQMHAAAETRLGRLLRISGVLPHRPREPAGAGY